MRKFWPMTERLPTSTPSAQRQVPLVVVAEGPVVQLLVVGDHHAAVPGVDGLEDVEGVGAELADRAQALAAVGAAEGLGRVLDEQQLVLFGDRGRGASRSQGLPIMCTARMARVCGVIRASTSAGSRVRLSSTSARTGTALRR